MKKLLINGEWIETKDYQALYSPFSQEKIADIPKADEKDVNAAISAAYEARGKMAKVPAHERATILEKLVDLISENKEECARLIALESAKPLKTARGEVARTIMTYKFAAEEARRINGETIPMDAAPGGEDRIAYTMKQPVGVVAAITPFNFPMNLVAHKVGPAIAAGNTVVLKPASQTPLSAYFIAELLQKAGLPNGALNVVTGSGRTVGEQLVTDERVKKVTFTGSPEVGIGIRNKSGLKKVTLELGSNSALIVDEGVDIDAMIDRAVMGAFANAGQVCISIQRTYIHESIFDEFVEKFVAKVQQLKLGDPLHEDTDLSALIAPDEADRVLEWINEAVEQGATLATGGEKEGNMLQPTVLLQAGEDLKVSCQEIFGPVVILNKVASIDEAIKRTNDSEYGLQAGIFTNDLSKALEAAEVLEVGGVMINDIPTYRVDHMPYGGVKNSGTGREGIKYAIEDMTELKLVVIKK
ncbi:aldehyde dehydrogenase family protein [Bacillus solimangrovi]|uniref:3-sulfolactaldehyde dehydrogenase n=1 Tax=Bacillus solimangrovi TaxID=1305675 RepID=A0A1E5LHR2_9BACI|nr:aldehyde dehydrogenase family protein [Bacillus solimangrovi]OEH93607.1 aldehyde dehydrogenase [Bacillus solimangrovi]